MNETEMVWCETHDGPAHVATPECRHPHGAGTYASSRDPHRPHLDRDGHPYSVTPPWDLTDTWHGVRQGGWAHEVPVGARLLTAEGIRFFGAEDGLDGVLVEQNRHANQEVVLTVHGRRMIELRLGYRAQVSWVQF